MNFKAVWKCVIVVLGELSVTMPGTSQMRMWFADSLDMVSVNEQ